MPTYKFPEFNLEIINPTVTVLTVHDNIQVRECNTDILLVTDTASFGINFTGFTYVSDWNDTDIINWVDNELTKYEI